MATALPFNKLLKALHIALIFAMAIFSQKAVAQTVLLPGDIVVVTANASNNSLGFIPLLDIEEGTSLYFTDGTWNSEENTLSGNELKLTFKSPVAAGTNLFVGKNSDNRIQVSGSIHLSDSSTLLAYQKEAEAFRFIYGLAWESSSDDIEKLSIPESLAVTENSFVRLGKAKNYQYYIRNGASGTAKMLRKFVGTSDHWRENSHPFPALGTSFTILNPPVVLFENPVSSTYEKDEKATLQVAIYEHDGSRLTVDVHYDSLRSITSQNDFDGKTSFHLNFTGHIGDGIYEVEVPIKDDNEFEGTETGIFTLKNLSNGNYGDFLSHSLIIKDNEVPNIAITGIHLSGKNAFIEITNNEEGVVSLSKWNISNRRKNIELDDDISIMPGESLKIVDQDSEQDFSDKTIQVKLQKLVNEHRNGEVLLSTAAGEVISRKKYDAKSKGHKETNKTMSLPENDSFKQTLNIDTALGNTAENTLLAGWKAIPFNKELITKFPEVDFFGWNETLQKFEEINTTENNDNIVLGYFEPDLLNQFYEWMAPQQSEQLQSKNELRFTLTATDHNKSETIDELEGLNLLHNNLDTEIAVNVLINEFRKLNPNVNFSSHIYTIDFLQNGGFSFTPKSGAEILQPNTPFWIAVENLQEEKTFSINKNLLTQAAPKQAVEEGNFGKISLSISNSLFKDEVEIHFSDRKEVSQIKDLISYPVFKLPKGRFLNLSMVQGKDYFSKIEFPKERSQNLSIPLAVSGTEDGNIKFEVSDWNEIPRDWEVKLVDTKLNKEYHLRQNFTLEIDIASKNMNNLEETNDNPRFYLNVHPLLEQVEKEDEDDLPKQIELYQNYPNPFNPLTTISFYMPESGEVKLSVFNIVGQPVAVLAEGTVSAGHKQFDWDATDRPSGMYIYQLEVGNKVLTRKMTLVK